MAGEERDVFDDAFVDAATVREADLLPPPSRESLREVRREAKERRRGPVKPRRGRRTVLALVVTTAVVAAGVVALTRLPEPRLPVPAQAPVVVPSHTPPPRTPDAFAGSRVESWPVGAAGIRPPAAKAVGAFSAAQVAAAYDRTAALLRTALLDRSVLYGRRTEPVLGRLAPGSARQWKDQTAYVMNRFDPRVVAPASRTVKVNGRMTARVADDALRVSATYVAVYALRSPGAPAAAPELVAVHRTLRFDFQPARDGLSAPWVSYGYYVSDHTPCGQRGDFGAYVRVVLDKAAAATQPPDAPAEDFDVLDPTAEPPKRCFRTTSTR